MIVLNHPGHEAVSMKNANLVNECLYWDTYTNTTTSHLCLFNEVTMADEKPTAQIR